MCGEQPITAPLHPQLQVAHQTVCTGAKHDETRRIGARLDRLLPQHGQRLGERIFSSEAPRGIHPDDVIDLQVTVRLRVLLLRSRIEGIA